MPQKLAKLLFHTLFVAIIFSLHSCKTEQKQLKTLFKNSAIVNDHLTGFALYDMDSRQMLYSLNASKYFTPASNTKLLTFYTSLKMLGDSVPALKYQTRGDSLFFWGTGDPSFLERDLKGTNAIEFLKQQHKKLFYCTGTYQNKPFGNGWAWDDYNDYYQSEISGLPIESNLINISVDQAGHLQTEPAYFKKYLKLDSNYHPVGFKMQRNYINNMLVYPAINAPIGFKQTIPWQTNDEITKELLQDTLKQPIQLLKRQMPTDAKTIYDAPADSVYRKMLLTSDNFIAEQLLLVCSSIKYGYLNSDSVRQYALKNYLADLPDKPQWADGSGLSRLDLMTPRAMIALLNKIADLIGDDKRMHNLLPAGGVSGTLKFAYKTDNGEPFVWAKTGSLSNNYNQSGYIITRKKRRLAFCFMNNNFTSSSKTVRDEMERIITYIHEKY